MFGDLSSSVPYLAVMVVVLASAYMVSRRMKSKNKLRLPPGPRAVPILMNLLTIRSVVDMCAMDYIIEAEKQGEITEDNVLYIVENMNIAGIETSLCELDEVLGRENLMQESDISKLPYLHAVVKETLRLHTAVPLLLPHMNLHQAKLGGYDIPAESKIVVNAWWLSNNPALWENPDEYRPERFLDMSSGSSKIDVNGNDMRYTPFGVGRRSCPGKVLALPLVSMVIGRLVQCFHLSTPKGIEKLDMNEESGQFSLHIAKHSQIVLKPR
eukprot:Gb_03866 [translate_table: standard]